MSQPNLFDIATSELSQDAFICWLLSWAKEEYQTTNEPLHKTAVALLETLLQLGGVPRPSSYRSVEVETQHKNIDILVLVNDDIAVIIEDKTDTEHHSDQLRRYHEQICKEFPNRKIARIYFKTGDQSNYSSTTQAGYSCFLRKDFLQSLDYGVKAGVRNDIFTDFYTHLLAIEESVQAYTHLPILQWNSHCWVGFFLELRTLLGDGDWKYVSNPSGGFMGYWWHWREIKYLQLEQGKLCYKIEVKDKALRAQQWEQWHQSVMQKQSDFELKIKRPRRADGTYMTVAVLDGDYRQVDARGIIDMSRTVALLKQAERLLDAASGVRV